MAEFRAMCLFAILIGLELTGGTILKLVNGCGNRPAVPVETETSGRLNYIGYVSHNCRWSFTLLKDLSSSVLAIHIKKMKMACTIGHMTFPNKDGGTEVCKREEPLCHVYARKNTWCDQEEIEQNTAMFYPECTAPKIHEEMNAMNLDLQITDSAIRTFDIEYQLFNCTPPNITTGSPITIQPITNAAETKYPSTAAVGITSSAAGSQVAPTSHISNAPTTPHSQHEGTAQDQATENSTVADYTSSSDIDKDSNTKDPGKGNEKTETDNNLWWIILLIIVVSLAVLAGVVYAVVRRRKYQMETENVELNPAVCTKQQI